MGKIVGPCDCCGGYGYPLPPGGCCSGPCQSGELACCYELVAAGFSQNGPVEDCADCSGFNATWLLRFGVAPLQNGCRWVAVNGADGNPEYPCGEFDTGFGSNFAWELFFNTPISNDTLSWKLENGVGAWFGETSIHDCSAPITLTGGPVGDFCHVPAELTLERVQCPPFGGFNVA